MIAGERCPGPAREKLVAGDLHEASARRGMPPWRSRKTSRARPRPTRLGSWLNRSASRPTTTARISCLGPGQCPSWRVRQHRCPSSPSGAAAEWEMCGVETPDKRGVLEDPHTSMVLPDLGRAHRRDRDCHRQADLKRRIGPPSGGPMPVAQRSELGQPCRLMGKGLTGSIRFRVGRRTELASWRWKRRGANSRRS